MKSFGLISRSLLAAAAALAVGGAWAAPVNWTNWSGISTAAASGNMGGVSVSAITNSGAMDGPSQLGCGTNFWTEPNPADPAYTGGSVSNAPTNCQQVGLNSPVSVTVTFGSAIDTLYMALLSVGQTNLTVSYTFDQAFTVDSEGAGFFGNGSYVLGAGNSLAMNEFHGVLRFSAPVSSLTFRTAPGENWHAFTFGAAAVAVPEPGSLALVGLALLAAATAARRKAA